ncbi:MAG: prepilin-type N-terminal cleavage/methylation domain-containing protein [Candidatus Omnitrophota bacterium]
MLQKKGFTLIELMVVIAIIAVLAAVMAPQIFKQIAKGRTAAAESFYNSVKVSSTSYFSDTGIWPLTCATPALCASNGGVNGGFIVAATTNPGWDGPYMERWPGANQNPFSGNYTWTSAVGTLFNGGVGAVGERYMLITNVPTLDAQRIDRDMDRVLGSNAGLVRQLGNPATWAAAGNVTVWILISRDGPTN